MTLCPIAIAVGCKQCPAFRICPLKSVIGDFKKPEPKVEPDARRKAPEASVGTRGKKRKSRAKAAK